MGIFKRRAGRPSYRRAILIYLVAIVGPALALLYMGLQSVERQREAINSLTAANLRLFGERLVSDLEQRVTQLATECLRDASIRNVPYHPEEAQTPEGIRRIRNHLAQVASRYALARHFFILDDGLIRYPALRSPSHFADVTAATGSSAVGEQFVNALGEAERQELAEQRLDLALASYRRAYELPVAPPLKAVALSRIARCQEKLRQMAVAEETYRTLGSRYGDVYDFFQRPYALVAALELDSTGGSSSSQSQLGQIYLDLMNGRWELSAEQLDYFREKLEARLGGRSQAGEMDYVAHLRFARALEESFRANAPVENGETYIFAFNKHDEAQQVFYTPLSTSESTRTLFGFSVNLNWVKAQLPQLRNELGVREGFEVALVPASSVRPTNAGETSIGFKNLFPFWEMAVRVNGPSAVQDSLRRDRLVFAGSTLLILSLLVLGVIVLIRDVHRQHQVNQLRSDFVSGVSHELKTPLTLIRLYAETLSNEEINPERRGYSEIITRESERLSRLIEKVLDFSRIDRGERQYELVEGDLLTVVAQTVEVYKQYLMRRGFSMQTNLVEELPLVRFDAEAVSQAILNLLDNAVKYSGESRLVGVSLLTHDGRVVFEVEDHGMGIPPDERDKIFQRFFRGAGASGKGGYGLGLFLVKHIMDAHGGTVEVETESGRGTRFRLVFPCKKS